MDRERVSEERGVSIVFGNLFVFQDRLLLEKGFIPWVRMGQAAWFYLRGWFYLG